MDHQTSPHTEQILADPEHTQATAVTIQVGCSKASQQRGRGSIRRGSRTSRKLGRRWKRIRTTTKVDQPSDVSDETSDSEGDEVEVEQLIADKERNSLTTIMEDTTTVPAEDATQDKRTTSMEDKIKM